MIKKVVKKADTKQADIFEITEDDKLETIRLLKLTGESHAAPGFENSIRRIFRSELSIPARTDNTGSIIVEKKGIGEVPRIMLTAHMDEVGFAVHSITKSGLIRFIPLGGWSPQTLLSQRVRILASGETEVIGVIGAKPPHLLSENEREKTVKIENMYIDVGAKNDEDIKNNFGIRVGDTIVPESPFMLMHKPEFMLCKAFDNRVGVSLVIQALKMIEKNKHPNTIFAVGTVQEEVGFRGAQTAAFDIKPDAAIVIEGPPADDLPDIKEDERQGVLGKGVQIRLMDPSAIMNRNFVQFVKTTAEKCGISYQLAVRKSGGTDARPIHLSGKGIPTVVLGVPARYIHTFNSIINLNDYLGALRLVIQIICSLDKKTVDTFTEFND